jgi:serine protease Do
MSQVKPAAIVSLGIVAVIGMVLGMVLTGGLSVTAAGDAAATPPPNVAPAASQSTVAGRAYPDFATLAERVNPSVISVYTEDVVTPAEQRRNRGEMDPFEFFFGPNTPRTDRMQPQLRRGAGSGFFISADGLAITNNHVVEGADKIRVNLADNTELKAKIIGLDPATDVALIKIESSTPTPFLKLGDSEAVRVGEWVMAAGNPLRMEHTITVGVVSAKGRSLGLSPETRSFENFIQTDAAINLGNSGGPLVNLNGEVIGINTAINAAGQNLGFAIPINTAKAVLTQLKERGKVVRGYLGVQIVNIDQKRQEAFNLKSRDGAFVESVDPGTPAAKAGIEAGDAVVAVGGVPIKETRQLIDSISALSPGTKVELDVIREQKKRTVTVTVGERPSSEEEQAKGEGNAGTVTEKLGLEVTDITTRTRRAYGLSAEIEGVVVTEVSQPSPADEAGLAEGDVILKVNGKAIESQSQFKEEIEALRSGSFARLYVLRPQAEQKRFVLIQVP